MFVFCILIQFFSINLADNYKLRKKNKSRIIELMIIIAVVSGVIFIIF